jgi:dCTP deaminase
MTPPAGILPCQSIEALIETGAIAAATPFAPDQVQPASLDLRLGARAWRVRASFLRARSGGWRTGCRTCRCTPWT